MRIIIGDGTEKAMSVLMIDHFPFSSRTLKKNYKKLIFKHHPDRNKNNEASTTATKQIINAFDLLKNLATLEITENEARIIKEQHAKEKLDIFTYWDPCKNCNKTGKIVTKEHRKFRVETCSICKGRGEVKLEVFNPVIPKGAVMI